MADARPTVILTRPEPASRQFAADLERMLLGRARILISPILEIVPEPVVADLSAYQTLIFTSANAVVVLGRRPELAGRAAYCVGDRTAEAAARSGFRAVSASGDAASLSARLLADRPPGPWLHPTGEHQRIDLAKALTSAGHRTERVVVYRQVPRALTKAATAALGRSSAILPVFSPRSAALLSEAMPGGSIPPLVVAISPAAANAWSAPARDIRVAPSLDAAAMAATIWAALLPDSPC